MIKRPYEKKKEVETEEIQEKNNHEKENKENMVEDIKENKNLTEKDFDGVDIEELNNLQMQVCTFLYTKTFNKLFICVQR